MRDTVHCLTVDEPDRERIGSSIRAMIGEVQKYVPGYRLANGPVFEGRRVSVFLEVAAWATTFPLRRQSRHHDGGGIAHRRDAGRGDCFRPFDPQAASTMRAPQ